MIERPSARDVARRLSHYLCGTRSGVMGFAATVALRGRPSSAGEICSDHAGIVLDPDQLEIQLGGGVWKPEEEPRLADVLRKTLDHPATVELILYGSQARGGRTGFSDVDAILVISDEAADDPSELRSLRPYVLAAQRAVLRYQPMQHHGFEVATSRLLGAATGALALPAAALDNTCSLKGLSVTAKVSHSLPDSRDVLLRVAQWLQVLDNWPRHPWQAHRVVAMFELLPTLYLQTYHASVAKSRSFAEARDHFDGAWWPYDVLERVRARWPRKRYPRLEHGVSVLRNPWAAVALWRRLPEPLPLEVDELLSRELLDALQCLSRRMEAKSQ